MYSALHLLTHMLAITYQIIQESSDEERFRRAVDSADATIDLRFQSGLQNILFQLHHRTGTVEIRQAIMKSVRDKLAAHFSGVPLSTQAA